MKIAPVNINNNQNFGIKFPKLNKKGEQNPIVQNPQEIHSSQIFNQLMAHETNKTSRPTLGERKLLREIEMDFTPEAEKIYGMGFELAKLSNSPQVETWHFHLAALLRLKDYFAQVQSGEINPLEEMRYSTATSIQMILSDNCSLWTNPELVNECSKIVNEQVDFMMKDYFKKEKMKHPKQRILSPSISSQAINDIANAYNTLQATMDAKDFADNYWLAMPTFSQNDKFKNDYLGFCRKLQTLGMTQKMSAKEKHHIEFYDTKADAIWKNIAHGNNVMIVCDGDNSNSYTYLQKSFINLINKPGQKYGSLSPDKTNIIILNEQANFSFINDLVQRIRFDKSKKDTTTIIMGDFFQLLKNDNGVVGDETMRLLGKSGNENPDLANIQFVFSIPTVIYQKNTQDNAPLSKVLSDFAQQTLPLLSAADAKKYLANESGLEFIKSKINKNVSKDGVYKAIEVTSSKNGNYPEKAIALLDAVAKFFVDSQEITPAQIETYLKETKSLSDTSDTSEKSVFFDTGKTISDIKGMPMTAEEAKSMARQIENGTIGTRGFIIQHNNGSSYGGGRRHTAEAIAGQTGIPMIVINAKDFALKDIDALSQEAGLSELKIKKIIQTARAQAEANRLNTAMIYIENFDNFGSNPLYGISSIYEQKAFTQLLAEMDAARKEGKVNLVVIGSMNMPETLDENILKPYKFLNQIIIYQPQDATQRREILDYYIEKNNYNIADTFEGQRETILNNISESTQYFSVVDLMYLLDQANIISKEREKNAIDGADFTESFLQITSGRTNTAKMSESGKKIVTSHETGHALNLHLMYEIAKKQDIPWHLPQKVDFITLDPRGDFGGAMFYKESENEEYSFERIMSDIITDYGGHSAENILYGMRGSWGISEDMRMADKSAKLAVTVMGMGQKTGVRHIAQDDFLSDIQKENIAQDVDRILKSGKKISDMIVEEYKEFIKEFTERHYSKVATGECIISASQFTTELNAWREKQTPEKLESLKKLEERILAELTACKGNIK